MAKIKRIGVIKMASFMGLYGFFIGLIFALLILIFGSLLSKTGAGLLLSTSSIGFTGFILFPLLYGILGFVGGLILTPVMNLALKVIKGLDFDLEIKEESVPPQSVPS